MLGLHFPIPRLHLPLYDIFKFFPAIEALHLAASNLHMLPYVFLSDPQTGLYRCVHIFLGQTGRLTFNKN